MKRSYDYPGLPDDSDAVRRISQLGHRIIHKAEKLEHRHPKLASWLAWQGLKAIEIAADLRGPVADDKEHTR